MLMLVKLTVRVQQNIKLKLPYTEYTHWMIYLINLFVLGIMSIIRYKEYNI